MSVRIDVRVTREQLTSALAVLEGDLEMVNYLPPAAGPEVEITVRGVSEERVVQKLTIAGITVLGSRTREGHG